MSLHNAKQKLRKAKEFAETKHLTLAMATTMMTMKSGAGDDDDEDNGNGNNDDEFGLGSFPPPKLLADSPWSTKIQSGI